MQTENAQKALDYLCSNFAQKTEKWFKQKKYAYMSTQTYTRNFFFVSNPVLFFLNGIKIYLIYHFFNFTLKMKILYYWIMLSLKKNMS